MFSIEPGSSFPVNIFFKLTISKREPSAADRVEGDATRKSERREQLSGFWPEKGTIQLCEIFFGQFGVD